MMKLSASNADVAHLVERNLAKVEVASSSLVIRSIIAPTHCVGVYFFAIADMLQLLCSCSSDKHSKSLINLRKALYFSFIS